MTGRSQGEMPGLGGDPLSARSLAEASQDCVWITRLDGHVDYMNPLAAALFETSGRKAGKVPDLRDLWPPEARFTLDRALSSAAAGQVAKFRTFINVREQARTYLETAISAVRDPGGEVARLLIVARDVTTEVETSAFLRTVIQLLPSSLTVKNVDDRRYVLINRAAEDLLGVVAEDALGKSASEVLSPDAAATFRIAEDEALAAGGIRVFDHQTSGAGGDPRHCAVKVLVNHDDLGPRHLIALAEDVTERRAAAERLEAALKAAEQASDAKSAFLANMSHEIRTPLNGIVAGADMLARDDLSDRSLTLVNMMRSSSEALERLLSDILDLARAESGQITLQCNVFHLGDAVRSAAALFGLVADQKGLTLDLDVDPALEGPTRGDTGRLRQVLSNLLSNAVKFTERGRIALRAVRTGGDLVRFEIEDTGVGFDPAWRDRIFGRFQQGDSSFTRRFGGAGLGLAVSREMVALMGGELDCASAPGRGSTFWFEIPLDAETAAAEGAGAPARRPEPREGLRVLLADDHPTNRQVVEFMLSGLADVVSVENGAEAVAAFQDSPFDLVLMDMQMPVMDGLDAIRELRRLEADGGARPTPIIMVTANSRPEHRAASARAGADLHLAKPLTAQALFSAIEDVLGRPQDEKINTQRDRWA